MAELTDAAMRTAASHERETLSAEEERRRTLIALMLPQLMVVLNLSAISVALPAIRETFNAPVDTMAWVVTIYMLPYVALMPLYGRLGDDLGIRRMILVSTIIFLAGTALNLLSPSLPLLMLGRFIQGAGASGIVPLAIAMIYQVFPKSSQGSALGRWNSIGPVASVLGSLVSGIIIDSLGWRIIFVMPLVAGVVTVIMVRRTAQTPDPQMHLSALKAFDWGGVLLLSLTLTAFLFYITSRSITGRPPLRDWRLLAITGGLLLIFLWYERRRQEPFIDLAIFLDTNLMKVCLSSATRMFVMSSTTFLIPLYLADLQGLNATLIGVIVMIRSAALFPTMYYGGTITDRWGSRRPIILGLGVQAASLILMAFDGTSWLGLAVIIAGLLLNGLGAGMALPALHRAAMEGPEGERGGAAAGVYSMIRFWGRMLGTAVVGVLLQSLLDGGTAPLASYRWVYAATALVGFLGVVTALTLPKDQ